ncbi:splicing factor, Prp19-binding domain-containing protein [Limtongia smithiae]|uniref:splicing factor, Prp19-binding domain-containing protein n=1 Tax=Limtongia smithiae TaxID=1125753 RepID=UPI0034CF2F63
MPPKRTRYFPGKRTSRSPSPVSSPRSESGSRSPSPSGTGSGSSYFSGSESERNDDERRRSPRRGPRQHGGEHEGDEAISYISVDRGDEGHGRQRNKPVIKELKTVDLKNRFQRTRVSEPKDKSALPRPTSAEVSAQEEGGSDDERHSKSEQEEASSEEESSGEASASESEEEAPKPVLLRPVFIPKSKRTAQAASTALGLVHDVAATTEEHRAKKKDETLHLIEQQVRADADAHARASLHAENTIVQELADLDDTDDIDPPAERAAWKLRELKRIRREREELEAREKELRELEERRNMDEDEKTREGMERVRQQREEKKNSGNKMGFMQKYYHKGAFYQDSDVVKRTDYSELVADQVKDKTALPKIMQVRGEDFGKRGRSKWTHLSAEDTSMQGDSPWFDTRSTFNKRAQDKLGGLRDLHPSKRKK